MPYTIFPLIGGVPRGANGEDSDRVNPVGGFILKKDIYIIKNTKNNKVYVGQSVNPFHRFQQHVTEARKQRVCSLLVAAMIEIGIDNFYYEILEHDIENFDEREQFWIKYYNSITPNGYNLGPGGKQNGVGFDNPSAKLDRPTVEKIVNDILYSSLSFAKIAENNHCSAYVVSAINRGEVYHNEKLTYPLKQKRKPKEIINQIIYALQYEHDLSLVDISKKWQTDMSVVCNINNGKIHRVPGKTYPLRKGRVFSGFQNVAVNIIEDLKEHKELQQKDIARKYNVSQTFVSEINKGTLYHQHNIQYPIRFNYQSTGGGPGRRLLPDEVQEIESLLKNSGLGMRKIAQRFNVSLPTIIAINCGGVIMYRQANQTYPIRKIKNLQSK